MVQCTQLLIGIGTLFQMWLLPKELYSYANGTHPQIVLLCNTK
jgi:hypothetical protein